MRLAEFSPLGLAIVDECGRYLYLNHAFTAMFGYTLKHFQTGRQWFRLAFPDPEYRHQVVATWKEGPGRQRPGPDQMPHHTFRVFCRNGSSKDALFRPVNLARGERIIVFEDVSPSAWPLKRPCAKVKSAYAPSWRAPPRPSCSWTAGVGCLRPMARRRSCSTWTAGRPLLAALNPRAGAPMERTASWPRARWPARYS